MQTRELLEKRGRLAEEARNLAGANDGNLDAEQSANFNTLKSEIDTLDGQIKRQAFVDELERRATGEPVEEGAFETETRNYSLTRAMAHQAGLDVDAGREIEISQELARRNGQKPNGILAPTQIFEKRVITTAAPVGGPGGNIIQETIADGQYYDLLRANMIMGAAGARILSGLVGNVAIPRLSASGGAAWVAENAALSPSDQEVTQLDLTPKHAGALSEYSRNLLLQSSPDIEQLVRDDQAKSLAHAIDLAAINGGGSNEPDGIIPTVGINTGSLAPATWAGVVDMLEELEKDNAIPKAWVGHPTAKKELLTTAKVASTDSEMIMSKPGRLLDLPFLTSSAVPTDLGGGNDKTAVILGDFSQVIIAYWSAIDVLVNPYESTAYTKGNVMVRTMATCDVGIRHPEAFCVAPDVAT